MRHTFYRGLLAALTLGGAVLANTAVQAQPNLATLARDVDREEGIRAVKNLQVAYAQYGQAGMWGEIGKLFAANGEAIFGNETVKGPAAIARNLRGRFGDGQDGIPAGGLHVQFQLTPVVNISADGKTAQGRWHEFALLGMRQGDAHWAGGIMENTYVKEGGVWKIAKLDYHPMLAGTYANGWHNVEPDLKIVPTHYTADSAGVPVPPASGALPGNANEAAVLRRIAMLNDEDKVRNLQNAYGYYVDRKMWDDVTDLFAADGVLEIAGQGIYDKPAGIRRALEIDGPQGLQHGELNDHLQLDEQIQIDGNEARIRGLEFGMLGKDHDKGYLSLAVFENRFVKQDGIWRIREMRIFPQMKTDYTLGWGESRIIDGPAAAPHAPDRFAPAADTFASTPRFFLPNPATGKMAAYPKAAKIAGHGDLLPGKASPAAKPDFTLADAPTQLQRSIGFDAAENLSSAIGQWIDDFDWGQLSRLFTADGARKMPSIGSYVGPERIAKAEELVNGKGRSPRTNIPVHMRTQPVIDVSADGRTAKIRSRLFQLGSSLNQPGSFSTGGMYEDQLALVNGEWKFTDVQIDHIWRAPNYKRGWIDVPENFGKQGERPLKDFPPDQPIKGSAFAPYPAIGRLWFHYKNPVSQRVPADYWGD